MKADPEAQRRLLDLQAIDTALAQLAHRRKSLPEQAELDRLARELSALEDERVRAQVAVDDLDRDIGRLEKDVDQVRARKDKDQARLDARHRPGPRAGGAPARAGHAQPPPGRAGGRRAGADGAAGDARRRPSTGSAAGSPTTRDARGPPPSSAATRAWPTSPRRRSSSRPAARSRSPPTCPPT